MRPSVSPTGIERFFDEDEIIVSKTDTKGVITYANQVFLRIAGYQEEEILGEAHKNMAKNGDHYWVFAHVTPTFDAHGRITGYHSSRRVPDRSAVTKVDALYRTVLAEERRHANWREGMAAGARLVEKTLAEAKLSYEEFAFAIK
jgi:PAS domain-containing protein